MLHAETLGQKQVNDFVEHRLLATQGESQYAELASPLHKNKVHTFSSLYYIEKYSKGKQKTIKVDRNIQQRLITAYRAGRQVNLGNVLKHELMPVPVSLAEMDGSLRAGNKSALIDVLIQNVSTPSEIEIHTPSTLIIDGQALVMALGMPKGLNTFGDLANEFSQTVLRMGAKFDRIDVTFDSYQEHSIKDITRSKRNQGCHPVRKPVNDGSVPLPNSWSNFMALAQNKEDLAKLLSEQLLLHAPVGKTIVVSGGFKECTAVKSSNKALGITLLQATHEEADTRIVLHCIHTNTDQVVVSSRDTDVLILLVAHFASMQCTRLWMKSGTAKKQKYLPIHDIHQQFQKSELDSLIAFHAITGCDSVSYLAGYGKKTAWKTFKSHPTLLQNVCVG